MATRKASKASRDDVVDMTVETGQDDPDVSDPMDDPDEGPGPSTGTDDPATGNSVPAEDPDAAPDEADDVEPRQKVPNAVQHPGLYDNGEIPPSNE